MEARQKLQIPPKPPFPRVLCKTKSTKRGSKGAKEAPSETPSSSSYMDVEPKADKNDSIRTKKTILPADILLVTANMKRNPTDSLGGTVSRLACERGIFAPANTSQALRSRAFDEVHNFLTSEIMAASAERQKLLRSQRLAAKLSAVTKPASGAGKQDLKKEDYSAPQTTAPAFERGTSRSLSAGGGRGGKNLGLGRGAKNLAALKARATVAPTKPTTDTTGESASSKGGEVTGNTTVTPASVSVTAQLPAASEKPSDNTEANSTTESASVASSRHDEAGAAQPQEKRGNPNQVVNRGRGLGKKNLLALRSRIVKPEEKDDSKTESSAGSAAALAGPDTQPDESIPAADAPAPSNSSSAQSTLLTSAAAREDANETSQTTVASAVESPSETIDDKQSLEELAKSTDAETPKASTAPLVGQPHTVQAGPDVSSVGEAKAETSEDVSVRDPGIIANEASSGGTTARAKSESNTMNDDSSNKAIEKETISEQQAKKEQSDSLATKTEKGSEEGTKPVTEGETMQETVHEKSKEASGEESKVTDGEKSDKAAGEATVSSSSKTAKSEIEDTVSEAEPTKEEASKKKENEGEANIAAEESGESSESAESAKGTKK